MAISTAELLGKLFTEPLFSEAVKQDIDVVALALDLSPDQVDLLKKIKSSPDMTLSTLAQKAGVEGRGLFEGGDS